MGWFRKHLFKAPRFAKATEPSPPSSSPPRQPTTESHDTCTTEDGNLEQLYKYTGGRWLWNEKEQFARRYVEFDLSGLAHVSTQALGACDCVSVTKLPEGNFSKTFLVTMDDGRELVAKLPNPNAGRPHLTTASEAATMDYV